MKLNYHKYSKLTDDNNEIKRILLRKNIKQTIYIISNFSLKEDTKKTQPAEAARTL